MKPTPETVGTNNRILELRTILQALYAWHTLFRDAVSELRNGSIVQAVLGRGLQQCEELIRLVTDVLSDLEQPLTTQSLERAARAVETANARVAELLNLAEQLGRKLHKVVEGQQVRLLHGEKLTPKTNRLYIDVTDAKWTDVQTLWPFVEWHLARLRERGLSTKRRRGEKTGPRNETIRHFRARVNEVGLKQAQAEFKAYAQEPA